MLTGLPGETYSDLMKSVEFLEKTGDSIDFINFSVFNLPEKSELTTRASEFGIEFVDDDVSENVIRLYRPFLFEGQNPRIRARRVVSEHFSRIPSVADALKRTPRWFRTTHFPFIDIPGRNQGSITDIEP
jgi:hypothetical protein